jgi:NADPH:quinone reductase-like Zn-dependent oxidoreductase
MMRDLSFDDVIDYTKEDFTNNGKTYDVILDAKSNRPVSHYLRTLKPGGIYVTVGGEMSRLFTTLLTLPFISLFTRKKIKIVALKSNKDLPYINKLFEAGNFKTVIDGHYTLAQVPDAFRLFSKTAHKGKIVITVDDNI